MKKLTDALKLEDEKGVKGFIVYPLVHRGRWWCEKQHDAT